MVTDQTVFPYTLYGLPTMASINNLPAIWATKSGGVFGER
jgi:hypothetical protein